jgi:uncharacterized membrane protein YeaQ/YmgE (transglycosylase-associated protein family)
MTILLWLILGLAAGASASRLATDGTRRVPAELAVGLVASIAGGLLFLLLG